MTDSQSEMDIHNYIIVRSSREAIMSADNGIYIAKFPDGYRVCYGAAIENVTYYPVGSEERKYQQKNYFEHSPIYPTEQEAVLAAHALSKEYEYLEYGISFLGELEGWDEEKFTCVKCGKDMKYNVPRLGADAGYVHAATGSFECEETKKEEWFHLRNIKPTEMQLWGGEKKICNLQGRWTEELAEFIRMANLGIAVHREEIKRRIESMLEENQPEKLDYDPNENTCADVVS